LIIKKFKEVKYFSVFRAIIFFSSLKFGMKIQSFNYQLPPMALNRRSVTEKKQDLSSSACQKPIGLVSRPDLAYFPSFGMLKKTKLDEYQLACANKFSAPLDKFNTNEEFNSWASKKLKEKTDLEQYKNEEPAVQNAVRNDLKEWKEYLYSDDVYKENPALSLIIFDAITKDISPDTHAFPPVLNKNVLSNTIGQLKDKVKSDPKSGFDFNKNYQNNLRLEYSKDIEDVGDGNFDKHWVKVSSKIHDPEHFEENVNKLKSLSCNTWCTRSTHAGTYLANGDFWVYLENNKPKVGVRFYGDKIAEIEGELNNQKIPLSYLDTIKTFISGHGFEGAEKDIKKAEIVMAEINKLHEDYAKDFENKKYDKILNEIGIKTKVIDNGMLELDKFEQPDNFTFEELGLDENELFKHIEKISTDASFVHSKVTDLGNLTSIGGVAYFQTSKVKDLGNLASIGGAADFRHSKVTNSGNLHSIGGNANFENSKVADLSNLYSIGGNADFSGSIVSDLGNLQAIGGDVLFNNSAVTDLGNLLSIGGTVSFKESKITNLGNLYSIGGSANFKDSKITNLGNLNSIGGNAHFENSKITDLGNLKSIGSKASFDDAYVITGNVQYIGKNVYSDGEIVKEKSKLLFYKPKNNI